MRNHGAITAMMMRARSPQDQQEGLPRYHATWRPSAAGQQDADVGRRHNRVIGWPLLKGCYALTFGLKIRCATPSTHNDEVHLYHDERVPISSE